MDANLEYLNPMMRFCGNFDAKPVGKWWIFRDIRVHWCSLVFIGVHWCSLAFIRVHSRFSFPSLIALQ